MVYGTSFDLIFTSGPRVANPAGQRRCRMPAAYLGSTPECRKGNSPAGLPCSSGCQTAAVPVAANLLAVALPVADNLAQIAHGAEARATKARGVASAGLRPPKPLIHGKYWKPLISGSRSTGLARLAAKSAGNANTYAILCVRWHVSDSAGVWMPKCDVVLHPSDASYLREVGRRSGQHRCLILDRPQRG